ncbi:hypothetical protein [Siccirubricoccus sp. G192]|uniref:hypothetical protein n=1 Tax=Siccirubricoccus sp. G192 TaxID=2849651 RepID=UPI001C2CB9C5|nr:hypothetical protein [Siccirubricoccus sp. G192]MBV1799227.1 hypothetical protein [Siccirubricoccus sp. G192]
MSRSEGISGAPPGTIWKFWKAACKARPGSGGAFRIWARARASQCSGRSSPPAMRSSHAWAAAAQCAGPLRRHRPRLRLAPLLRGGAGREAAGEAALIALGIARQPGQFEALRQDGRRGEQQAEQEQQQAHGEGIPPKGGKRGGKRNGGSMPQPSRAAQRPCFGMWQGWPGRRPAAHGMGGCYFRSTRDHLWDGTREALL